jgi:hypothetical protein
LGFSFSAQLLGQSDDDALRAADVAEQIAVLEPGDLADEFAAVRAQAGNGVLEVVDGEHDPVRAQNVVRPVARPDADHRGAAVLRQLAWEEFTSFLRFDTEIRRIVCTTNAIESVNARIRRAVKARGHFPNEQAP